MISQQLVRFGIIGVIASAIHTGCVIVQVERFHLAPLMANVFAFCIAFVASYTGHRYWTFAAQRTTGFALGRYLLVALTGFALNEALFYFFLRVYHLYYLFALLLVLFIVPGITFVLSKVWAFRESYA